MRAFTFVLAFVFPLLVAVNGQEVIEEALPYGYGPPRENPDYCVGFTITYPTKYGETFKWGEMTYISWEVDKDMESPPDMITRIRVMNSAQRNMHIIGENITIYTHEYKGGATFPLYTDDADNLLHYRIMVNYPGQTVHCIYESVPFYLPPKPFRRYTVLDTPPPSFATASAVLVSKEEEENEEERNCKA